MSDIWHVYPTDDLKEHNTGSGVHCHCEPRVETQPNGNNVVIHNAYDGREFFESDQDGHQTP